MATTQTIIERAFELAKSGTVQNVVALRCQLKVERFNSVDAHLASASLSKQLLVLIRTATGQSPLGGSCRKAS
jgi:hypothetical protein